MFDDLAKLIEEKYISVQTHEQDSSLKIYNYTAKTQFDNFWNETTMHCRGLIMREGMIVARGPKKIFNATDEQLVNLKGIYEKADGSLGIPYEHHGDLYIATRGAFHSDQAKEATTILHAQHDEYLIVLIADLMQEGRTPVFEIIYPENQIVVNYGDQREIVYIGSVDNETGLLNYEIDREAFEELECPVVKKYFKLGEIPEGTEGFVVQLEDQTCLKIKSEWYLKIHRLLGNRDYFGMVISSLLEDNMSWIEDVPDEFYEEIKRVQAGIEKHLKEEIKRLRKLLDVALEEGESDREIALQIQEFPEDQNLLFVLWRKGEEHLRNGVLRQMLQVHRAENQA